MAVMGVQVVVSLLAASVMQKLAPHCSFARWLLCNGSLHRYKHPSEEELRALAGKQRPKAKRDRRVNGVLDDKPLSVPRDIDLRLDTSPITAVDALVLRYFLEYQWFVDFAVYSTAVYVFTEGYFCLADPQKETNIGVLWCLLTVVFSVKVFFMVMRHYFRSEEGGERSVCLTFAFFFLLLAMVALVIREDYLEFGLEPGGAGRRQQQPGECPEAAGLGVDAAPRQAGLQAGAGGPVLLPGRLPDFPGAAPGPDAPRRSADGGRQAPDPGPAPREFPGARHRGGDVDQAHLEGFPAPRAHGQADGADHVGLCLQHRAPLDHRRPLPAAPGRHPPPPAGLPVPGRALGGADEEGSGAHRRRGDPAQDHEDLLLRVGGQPAVPGARHPHPALRAAPQNTGAPLVGAVPGALSRPSGSDRGTVASRQRGRGGRACRGGADHGRLGRHLHPSLLPRTPRLPHLVGGRLPGRHQPLRPLLPPVPGSILTGGAGTCLGGTVSARLLVRARPVPTGRLPLPPCCCLGWAPRLHVPAVRVDTRTCTWGHFCSQLLARRVLCIQVQRCRRGHRLLPFPLPFTTVPVSILPAPRGMLPAWGRRPHGGVCCCQLRAVAAGKRLLCC